METQDSMPGGSGRTVETQDSTAGGTGRAVESHDGARDGSWRAVATLEELSAAPRVLREGRRQIVVLRWKDGVSAIDNRCPHEGYPLAKGSVDEEGNLTCNWHNWKFRLTDGACLLGGDHVRRYPTKVEDGRVWVDLSPPPREQVEARVLEGLRGAFVDRDFGRLCRELSRLHFEGIDPRSALRHAIAWSHDRLEYGTGHAYAAAVDWLDQTQAAADWETRLIGLAEAIDHMAEESLRQPPFPYAGAPGPWSSAAFQDAVERKDTAAAEGLIRAALAAGLHVDDLLPDLARAALAHYNDFGHSAIYVQKAAQMVDRLGEAVEPHILPALARHLTYTTRDDLIPEFALHAKALAELPEPPAGAPGRPAPPPFPASLTQAVEWLHDAAAHHSPEALHAVLLEAAARNLLHFDESYGRAHDRPVADNVGWLDFTHAITFGGAVRELAAVDPALWRPGLLQMACFLGRNRKYVDPDQDLERWKVHDLDGFHQEVGSLLLDHGQRDPIFSCHLLKTYRAALAAASYLEDTQLLWQALNRFLHGSIKQKHVRRLARQAIDLVGRDYPVDR